MNDLLTQEHLARLVAPQEGPCVSIYLPTHKAGRDKRGDPVALDNLLNAAEAKLSDLNQPSEMLAPIRDLLTDSLFWQQQSDGLAIFASPQDRQILRLPRSFTSQVHVNDFFYVHPLLPLLQADGEFMVLAVSQKAVRLFRGSQHRLTELSADELPKNLVDAIGQEEYQPIFNMHAFRQHGHGDANLQQSHGHGSAEHDDKNALRRYFKRIDRGMSELLEGAKTPVVFAGVDYLFPICQEACQSVNLFDQPVTGNMDQAPLAEVHQKAWSVVEPAFQESLKVTASRYGDLIGVGRASDSLKEISQAAAEGRIDTLLLVCDDQQRPLVSSRPHDACDTEPLEKLTMRALQSGARVLLVEPGELPTEAPVAAIFRYAMNELPSQHAT